MGQNKNESNTEYKIGNQIKYKTSMLRSSLFNYSYANIIAKGTVTVPNKGAAAAPNKRNKNLIFKNWLHKWNKQYRNRSC